MNIPSSAARVWATPELRGLIINQMAIDDARKSLCLSKSVFPDMVKVLYRRFHFKDYASLLRLSVPYVRRNIYIESIRSLQVKGQISEIKDVRQHQGFSDLLDTFPLATEIIVGKGDHRLITPPRLLIEPSHPQGFAELHVNIHLKSQPDNSIRLNRVYPKIRAYHCVVIYNVTIGRDCQIDWDLSVWGRMVSSGATTLSPWPRKHATGSAVPKVIPFCVIHDREIASMSIKQSIDLDTLSKHLEQRRQMSWEEIKQ